jgi:fatty-acyl-CoA synthase
MWKERAREVTAKARMFARVAHQTGMLRQLRPTGAAAAARSLLRGASGPSAIFRVHAANQPERPAFLFEGRTLSYGEVDERIDRLATGLRRRGMGKGDSAVLMLRNRPESVEIGAAMSRLGASGVAASWRSTPAELAYLARNSGARAIFFEAELWPTVEAALRDLPGIAPNALYPVGGEVAGRLSVEALRATAPERGLSAQEGAVIIYTSGTTGRPKGAVRRFGRGQLEGFFAFIGETPMRVDDRHLCVCPMYHSTGLGFVGMTLLLGGLVVIHREFDPEEFLATVDREHITTTALVPTMLHRLMALPDETFRRYDTRSLRAVFCGGAQLAGPLALRAMEKLGPVLYNFYGATETGLVTVATPEDLRAAPGTIGRAVPGTTIRLLDEQGREVPRGEVGELYARNAMLVEGYHADEEATRASLRDGFFSVGDLATQDAAGRFHIAGRKRDMVISGGVNIYPAEVEAALEAHPGVAQAAVIGVPDEEWGERLRAFVVTRAGHAPTADELRAWCRARLSGPKTPREWVFLEALPSNPTGKILKRELRAYEGRVERV